MTESARPSRRGADPAPRIEAVFADIARSRMAGLPFLNPALSVEAVDFGQWQDQWLGVLITPWCINLILLAATDDDRSRLAPGDKRPVRFPVGTFEFIGGHDPRLGAYESCSLFSPVLEFADQTAARLTARAARRALFEFGDVARTEVPETIVCAPPLSRRSFLRGAIAGNK
jgi:[NiFe] hydrogenase assembly HybE family chaperone